MKRIVILSLIQLSALGIFAVEMQKKAEAAYIKGNYTEAAQIFESILKENGESAQLYYNLGNAYFKADQIAPAILNYERALLLAPGDADIRNNLEIARLKTVDKITPVGKFLLTDWILSVRAQMNSNQWAVTGIVLFLIFIFALFVFFFAGRLWMKKTAFFGGILFLLLSIFSNYSAYRQKQLQTERNQVIVFSSSVVVKSTPDDSGTDLFVVHQGTKAAIKDKVGEWTRIQLEDGNDGWLKNEHIQQI